jgi:hypothetical protein
VRIDGVKRLFLAGVTILAGASAACGDFIRQDRSAVTLVVDRLEASSGLSTTFSGTLQSDVVTVVDNANVIYADGGRVTMRLIMKDVGTTPSPVNAITINRYRVTFRRTDGLNTPGVDVPFPLDSAVGFTVPTSGTVTHAFELIRPVAKLEAPLMALRTNTVIISTIADITFFGRDQAGNEISVAGSIGVHFGNFADPD